MCHLSVVVTVSLSYVETQFISPLFQKQNKKQKIIKKISKKSTTHFKRLQTLDQASQQRGAQDGTGLPPSVRRTLEWAELHF